MTLKPLLTASLLIATANTAAATEDVSKLDLTAMPLNAHPSFERIEGAMITGAFSDDALYAANSVLFDGALFPPHRHNDARMSLVIEGTMYLGTGETVDAGAETAYPAGTVALTPAGTMHWMAARGEDVRIIEIGSGPSETVFAR